MWATKKYCVAGNKVAAKKECCCVCVCCTVFDTTHPLRVVCFKWVCVGGFSVKGTPGPVPIPVAKLDCADGTAIVGLWESKTPPTLLSSYVWGVPDPLRRIQHTPHFLCPEKRGGGLAAMLLAYQPTVWWGVSYLLLACVLLSNASDVEKLSQGPPLAPTLNVEKRQDL